MLFKVEVDLVIRCLTGDGSVGHQNWRRLKLGVRDKVCVFDEERLGQLGNWKLRD